MQTIKPSTKKFQQIHENQGNENWFENFTDKTLIIGHSNQVLGVCICQERNLLASGSLDQTAKLWNLENNSLIRTYELILYRMLFSRIMETYQHLGVKDNIVYELLGHTNDIKRLTFSNDSKLLISVSDDTTVRIWDCQSKKEKFNLNQNSLVRGIAISADDTVIASNSYDSIKIWNLQTQKLLCTQPADVAGHGIQFSNNQKMLVASNGNGIINLWSLQKLNQSKLILIRKLKAGTSLIWTILFSPCSRYILTIYNRNRTIKVLDIQTGLVVKEFVFYQTWCISYYYVMAISKNMDIIAYPESDQIVVLR